MPVSRALLHTVMEQKAPAMIGHTADGSMHGDVVEVSVMSPVRRMCAVACPLKRQNEVENAADAVDLREGADAGSESTVVHATRSLRSS
jgi:hypothetical protein